MSEEAFPKSIQYCRICTLPVEYCKNGENPQQCEKAKWKKPEDQNFPTEILIQISRRKYNKEAMLVSGLLEAPGVDKSKLSKSLKKLLNCGINVTEGKLLIQAVKQRELVEYLVGELKVPARKIFYAGIKSKKKPVFSKMGKMVNVFDE
ncbi:hypothetical protein MHBO_000835 [Bonamia ostreae]|uniref:SUI1 domain-containing protein n=1 Tax=Bonamia ostreae TaxID=126728 RepID=A0ABV2AGY9_9EUKA